MENTKKITRAMKMKDMVAILSAIPENVSTPTEYGTTIPEAIEFLNYELEKDERKRLNSKTTPRKAKQNEEDVTLSNLILDYLSNNPDSTCTDMNFGIPELTTKSNQKVSGLVRKLKNEGKVTSHTTKSGVTTFALAEDEGE